MPHHNSAVLMMTNFQIHFHHPQRLLRQKIQNLYQRNQNIVRAKSNLCDSFLPELIYYTCYYFLFTDRCRKMRYKQGNSFPYVIFPWCQMCQNFFNYLLPTDIAYCFKYNIILCQLFFQQTGAVKTLPPHNPISLTLRFFYIFQ